MLLSQFASLSPSPAESIGLFSTSVSPSLPCAQVHLYYFSKFHSLVAQMVKNSPAMWETWVQSLDWEDPLEKGKVTGSMDLENSMDRIAPGVTKSWT